MPAVASAARELAERARDAGVSVTDLGGAEAESRFSSGLVFASGAYTRIRRQFNMPVGKFEGVEALIARMVGYTYTMDAARSWARAVAVRDGAIVAIGTDDEVTDLRGDHTEVVDLAGRMLLPGFQDAHVHPVGGGLDMLQCDPSRRPCG